MNGNNTNETLENQIRQLGEFLYGVPRNEDRVEIQDIYQSLPHIQEDEIDHLLGGLEDRGLVRLPRRGDDVILNGLGKLSHEADCLPELMLGMGYIQQKYAPAVLHIIVRDREGDEHGGTGFFVADPVDTIVTAKHVLQGKELRRIERETGQSILEGEARTYVGIDDLDLAMIRVLKPADIHALRVEWNIGQVERLNRVIMFGYPPVPGHSPELFVSSGEVNSTPKSFYNGRVSLTISANAQPGCSGGPVVNAAGFVVGVVRDEGTHERQGQTRSTSLIYATPAGYLRDLLQGVNPKI